MRYLKPTSGWTWLRFTAQVTEYAYYKKGTKRIKLTERLTKQILVDFKKFLKNNKSVNCITQNYFLGRTY